LSPSALASFPPFPLALATPPRLGKFLSTILLLNGLLTKSSGYVKPSTPAEFTGAASAMNAAGFVAGVGAFAAFFL
jgi:hypothetical protein